MSTNEFLMRALAQQFAYDLQAPPKPSTQEPLPLIDDPAAVFIGGQQTAA
ncbi:hypothetical protein [Nonomuraea dietziae]